MSVHIGDGARRFPRSPTVGARSRLAARVAVAPAAALRAAQIGQALALAGAVVMAAVTTLSVVHGVDFDLSPSVIEWLMPRLP